jgi:tripartite-type tricarboxylate transporter receptor subunit TctC
VTDRQPPWKDVTARDDSRTKIGLEIPDPQDQSPEALAAFQKAEIDKWWPVIKAAGIKAR